MSLKEKVMEMKKSEVGKVVGRRLREFKDFAIKNDAEWFSELCFCILTANSKAKTAIAIQEKYGDGFVGMNKEELSRCIRECKHRFHNNKAEFIVGAREYIDIKDKIQNIIWRDGQEKGREWLADSIKGIGFKEASHFLRNVGFFDLAILDRHILKVLHEYGVIDEVPKSLSKKVYLDIEKKFKGIAGELGMSLAELDLYVWYIKTGEVLK